MRAAHGQVSQIFHTVRRSVPPPLLQYERIWAVGLQGSASPLCGRDLRAPGQGGQYKRIQPLPLADPECAKALCIDEVNILDTWSLF